MLMPREWLNRKVFIVYVIDKIWYPVEIFEKGRTGHDGCRCGEYAVEGCGPSDEW